MDNQDLNQILDKFIAYGFYESDSALGVWKIFEAPFKNMIGMIGKFFIGDRMFETIRTLDGNPNANSITLRAYLKYTDIIYNGTLEEKDKISFLMININGQERVYFVDYK